MKTRLKIWLLATLMAGIVLPVSLSAQLADQVNEFENFVAEHCLECHTSDDPAGNFDFEAFDFSAEQFSEPELNTRQWEKILLRIETRQMPPVGAARPSEVEYDRIAGTLGRVMSSYSRKFPNPGRIGTIRRLTRTEYKNVVRDLVGIEINAEEFLPRDESSHGFDNITVETLPPTLFDRYVTAAEKISRLAMGGAGNGPIGVTIRMPADRSQEKHVAGLPFGTRGGTVFSHQFLQDGEYEIELKLTRDRDEKVEGLNRKHELDVLLDRKRIHQFTIEPPKGGGNWDERDFTHSDSHLKYRFRTTAGPHNVGVTFPSTFSSLVQDRRQPFDANFNRHRHPRKTPAIYQVSIVGPLGASDAKGAGDTPSRRLILGDLDLESVEGRETELARNVLSGFVRRAFRRPVTDEDLITPMRFFETGMKEGGFQAGIESAVASVLVNPNFLLKVELDEPSATANADLGEGLNAFRVSDVELASRLSFFLWSTMPDEELLELAEAGQLQNDEVLKKQVERMLADKKSESLVKNFAGQWLYLRNLESITPNLRLFPDFDDNLRQAFRGETEHLFRNVLNQNRSVLRLIQSDQAFLNERLATHYGISGVRGSHFRSVDLAADSKRGGLLRQGSILMVTSYATRTSPTIRGSWVLENILGTPPPPQPPNVPALKERTAMNATSVRDRLAMHRKDPACASCHNLIDPVGFALENYDAVGRWREFDDTLEIDSTGVLPDGTEIENVMALEKGILKRPEAFVRTLTEKLMTFGLGRSVEPFDGPAIREIVAAAKRDDFRFRSIVTGIVLSDPFRKRSKE